MNDSGELSRARLVRLHEIMAGHVARGAAPGLVALVSRGGETHVETIGVTAVAGDQPMRRDTIFRIASLTKPITAAAAMLLMSCQGDRSSGPSDTAIAPILDAPDAVDIHSYAKPLEARVTHVDLDLAVDFEAKRIGGTATLDIQAKPGVREVVLDDKRLKIEAITDGTSNTLAVGECIFDTVTEKRAAIWPGMSGQRDGGVWISDVMWWVDEASARINGPASQAFGSRHPGGAFFNFCDGSVRFFREGGDVDVVRWLGGRNDGRVVTAD